MSPGISILGGSYLLTCSNVMSLLLVAFITYLILLAVYRVTLHPLAKFPGPKLAGMTYWYEFYYNVIKFGHFTNQIGRMHKRYGPIVRIGPDELHCNDLSFADEIYAGGGRIRDKWYRDVDTWGSMVKESGFGTIDHHHHRRRRNALNKMFSTTQISNLEPGIHTIAQKLCDRMLATKGPFDLAVAFSCFSIDVITDYSFDGSKQFLNQDSWYPNFRDTNRELTKAANVLRQFPWLNAIIDAVPLSWIKALNPGFHYFLHEIKVRYPGLVKKAIVDHEKGTGSGRPTIFNSLLESSLPDEEKTVFRLAGEAQTLLGAGAETTSWALATGTFHLLDKPKLLQSLTKELETVITNPEKLPPWRVLEELPYLTGVVKESVRLGYGVSMRTMRTAPTEDLIYPISAKKTGETPTFVIPRGYAIGMSNRLMHIDPEVFPDAETYDPTRWITEKGERNKELDSAFQPFGRGTRRCLGINLAYCELYYAFAALALRVFPHLKLYETTVDDVKYHHDEFVSGIAPGSKGVRGVIVEQANQ